MEPQSDKKEKRTFKQIMNSKVSVSSDDKTVKYLSILLILSAAELLFAFYSSVVCDYDVNIVEKKQEQTACSDSKATDDKIGLIDKYYELISSQKNEEAYAMTETDDMTFEKFESELDGVEYMTPERIMNAGGNIYDYVLRSKKQGAEEIFSGLRIVIADGRIDVVSSDEFDYEEASHGDYEAYTRLGGDRVYLLLAKGDKETIVDVGDYSEEAQQAGFHESFSNLTFSPDGNYLMYNVDGFESTGGRVYDARNGKRVLNIAGVDVGEGLKVTPDSGYFYACLGVGLFEKIQGVVYEAPGFEEVFNATDGNNDYANSECEYDREKNAIVFSLSEPYDGDSQTKTLEFALSD